MKLKKLTLKNFKGLRNYGLDLSGGSATVFGDNATGKTTLFDALCWLLFDKDSHGRSTGYFSIKTQEGREVIHDIDHSVEGIFDGITLQKIYKENWVTKRGGSTPELKGHTTDYYLDQVPVNKSEYDEAIGEIMSEEHFKMLTNPMYFPEELHWSERRKQLLAMCGEVVDADIIAGNEELLEYPQILDGKTQAQRKKMLKESRKKLDKELENIPSRIDELNGRLYQVEGVEEAKQNVTELKAKKDKIEAKRSEVKSGGALAELKVKAQELQAKYKEGENAHDKKLVEAVAGQRDKVSTLQDKVDEIESEFREAKRDYEQAEQEWKDQVDAVEMTKKELEEIAGREPKEDSGPDVCPMCERPMESGSDHDYDQYVEEFNAQKASDRKDCQKKLTKRKEQAADLEAEVDKKGKDAANLKGKLSQRKQALQKAEIELKGQKKDYPDYADSEAAEQIEEQIEQVDQKIADHRGEKLEQLNKLEEHITDLAEKIETAEKTIHQSNENKRTQERICELRGEQKGYAKELEKVEHQLYVIEQFVMEQSRYITRKVNDLFDIVEWKLFEEQINGGIKPVCEPLVEGIPFGGGLNTGSRIKAGLDIISALSAHTGKSAPCFLDNSEAVTKLPKYDFQIIALYVSDGDEKLRVESGLERFHKELEVA